MRITGTLKNQHTGETRKVSVSLKKLQKESCEGVSRCAGPCFCKVETDGICPKGWPARFELVYEVK